MPGVSLHGALARAQDWGHWVSRDFVKWARLPVSIWNDKWYDSVAIFSGSTTIVDGKPVIVCKTQHPKTPTTSARSCGGVADPGLCNKDMDGNVVCPTRFTVRSSLPAALITAPSQPKLTICCGLQYVAVVPSDAKDPFYTNWTKEGPLMNGLVNPIVNSTGDDPSTAWQNPAKTGASSNGRLGLVVAATLTAERSTQSGRSSGTSSASRSWMRPTAAAVALRSVRPHTNNHTCHSTLDSRPI